MHKTKLKRKQAWLEIGLELG